MTAERLAEFGEAWNRHDPDLLMTYMADECSYFPRIDVPGEGETAPWGK